MVKWKLFLKTAGDSGWVDICNASHINEKNVQILRSTSEKKVLALYSLCYIGFLLMQDDFVNLQSELVQSILPPAISLPHCSATGIVRALVLNEVVMLYFGHSSLKVGVYTTECPSVKYSRRRPR